jgi:long-chain acyl-CoA synthetase
MVTPKSIEPKRPAKVYDTLPKLVRRNYDQWAIETALCKKKYGIWEKYSWRKYYEIVRQLSLGLISLGLQRSDIVCLLGDNEPEWLWCEFAVQAAGGIPAGVPAQSTAEQAQYILKQSGAKFAFVTAKHYADKFLNGKDLPALRKIIYLTPKGLKGNEDPRLLSFHDVLKLGEEYGKANPAVFEQNIDTGRGDDTAFIFYTLNGKGLPKGAVMTHKALISSAEGLRLRFPVQPEDHLMAALPAASGENSYFAALLHLLSGAALNYPETPETTVADTRETGPDFAAYNAGQWENLASAVKTRIKGSNPVARFFYQALFPAGNNPAGLKLKSKKPNLFRRLWNLPADRLFFAPLKDKTGLSHTRFAVNYSGTPLSKETVRLMLTLGVEIRQTYSLAETGLIAGQGPAENDFDTTGRPTLDTEIRIMADGEMLVRSSGMFSGYYNDPSATAAVMQDGWYRTGIPAQIDEKGQLKLVDPAATKKEGT